MFTEFEKLEGASVNKNSDLVAGVYYEKQQRFADEDGDIEVLLRKFTRTGDEGFSVVDALVIDKKKDDVLVQDFLLLPNGRWRAGDGSESFNLNELFPDEFTELRLVSECDGDVIEVPEVAV